MNSFVICNAELCIGCQACMVACARAHENLPTPVLNRRGTPFHTRITVVSTPEVTVAVQCRQCEDSPCARSCPEGALVQKDSHIEVIKEKCIGCKSCIIACPFGAIRMREEKSDHPPVFLNTCQGTPSDGVEKAHFIVEKCDLCTDYGSPACVSICPAGALQLINPDDVARKIRSRQKRNVDRIRLYHQHAG